MAKKHYTYQEACGGEFGEYGTDTPREPVIKAAQMITDRMGHKVNGHDPDYYGLAGMITDEMAEIALKMEVRKPKTLSEIAKLTGKDEKHLEEVLEQMAYIGFAEYEREGEDHQKRYSIKTYIPGSAEMLNMHPEWYKDHPELAQFFDLMTYLPLAGITQMVPPGGAGIGMHVIPVEKAIETEQQSMDIEHLSHWLDKYDGKYALCACSCRLEREQRKDGCVDDPDEWCIGVGDFADYMVETKKGRYGTREEVMEVFKRAEDNGFVHQITNVDGKNKIFGICNCDVKICNALRTSQLFNTPNLSRSAYTAKVDPKNCVACGGCVEYCPVGAVKLGQKLCRKNGTGVNYPKMDLPDDHKWSEERWDPDYRNTEREECYDTGTAPCKSACPAHIAVQGYLKLASQGKYTEALALIKKENPFPAVCGRVCNHKCEDECTRGTVDEAIAIEQVKKFLAQRDIDSATRYIPPVVIPSAVRDHYDEKIAIIGGGPAGLSCAYYLATKGYKPTVFERNEKPGGMLVYGIPSYKLEKDVVAAEIDVMKTLGVEIKCGVDVGKDVSIDELRAQGYKAFYVSIGCQGSRKGGFPGEDAKGVISAIDHLRMVGADNGYKVNGRTVVVGGGNVAIDAARTAARVGSKETSMFCLETRDIMPASADEIQEAEEENIAINCGWGPKEILKDENGNVKGVTFRKCTSVFNSDHKFDPKYDDNDTMTVECENVITCIGQCIDWGDLISGEKNIKFVHGNYPEADKVTFQTAQPDIFVGGDVYHGPSFAINAIAEGKEGAESINRFVRPTCGSLITGRAHRNFIELNKDDITVPSYDNTSRQVPHIKDGIDRKTSFKEYLEPFTEDQVKAETARCLSCGASVVDENKCIGCGICTTKCEFDAIHLSRTLPEASNMVRCEDRNSVLLPYIAKRSAKIIKHKISKK